MICKTFDYGTNPPYKYVVVLSYYQGKILLSRHRDRATWETQGGHIETGEAPVEAARRELYEESGAMKFDIRPVCDYYACDESGGAGGVVFTADIYEMDPLPASEMAEVRCFDTLPENVTYPDITPVLFQFLEGLNEQL